MCTYSSVILVEEIVNKFDLCFYFLLPVLISVELQMNGEFFAAYSKMGVNFESESNLRFSTVG